MSCSCLMLYPHKVHTVFPVNQGQASCPWCVFCGQCYVSCDQLRGLVAGAHSSFSCGLAFMSHAIILQGLVAVAFVPDALSQGVGSCLGPVALFHVARSAIPGPMLLFFCLTFAVSGRTAVL